MALSPNINVMIKAAEKGGMMPRLLNRAIHFVVLDPARLVAERQTVRLRSRSRFYRVMER